MNWIMWPWNKKKVIAAPGSSRHDPITEKLNESEYILEELAEQSKAGVTKSDFLFAVCLAVLEKFPEIKDSKAMLTFKANLEAYEKEHSGKGAASIIRTVV